MRELPFIKYYCLYNFQSKKKGKVIFYKYVYRNHAKTNGKRSGNQEKLQQGEFEACTLRTE